MFALILAFNSIQINSNIIDFNLTFYHAFKGQNWFYTLYAMYLVGMTMTFGTKWHFYTAYQCSEYNTCSFPFTNGLPMIEAEQGDISIRSFQKCFFNLKRHENFICNYIFLLKKLKLKKIILVSFYKPEKVPRKKLWKNCYKSVFF